MVGQAGAGQGGVEHVADRAVADPAAVRAEPALEQQRGRADPQAFAPVVCPDEGDRPGVAADPADDDRQHVGQFRADDQEPFGVGLRRDDLQQRDELAGAGQPVLDQAVVADLQELLDADAGQAQYFHGGPGPERQVLLHGQIASFPGDRIIRPDLPAGRARGHGPGQGLPRGREGLARVRLAGGLQQFLGVLAPLVDGPDQDGQDGKPFPGAGVHA